MICFSVKKKLATQPSVISDAKYGTTDPDHRTPLFYRYLIIVRHAHRI